MSYLKKQSRFQVNEILNFLAFLVNGHLKFTYSTSKVKIIIYQFFNVKIFLNTIPLVNFKNTLDLSPLKFSKHYIQHTINSILCTMMV
jgi:hypothetical protein